MNGTSAVRPVETKLEVGWIQISSEALAARYEVTEVVSKPCAWVSTSLPCSRMDRSALWISSA